MGRVSRLFAARRVIAAELLLMMQEVHRDYLMRGVARVDEQRVVGGIIHVLVSGDR